MKPEPPSAHAVRLRTAMKSLVAAVEVMVRETSADPNTGDSATLRERAVDELLVSFKSLAEQPDAPQGESSVATMAEVHARLERTFRLYLRADAAGKAIARKEMRRVVSEIKADSRWQ